MPGENFNVGDVVKLKSGGPSMTAYYCTDEGQANCKWFDVFGSVCKDTFSFAVLEKSEPTNTVIRDPFLEFLKVCKDIRSAVSRGHIGPR